jgi:hypothetical protein
VRRAGSLVVRDPRRTAATETNNREEELTMETTKPKPPVKLIGEDGNAFAVLGACMKALRGAGYTKQEVDAFVAEATSGDYDHVLCTAMRWCEVW